jgi:hypothetical protein
MCKKYYIVSYFFKFAPATVCLNTILSAELTYYGRILKSVACVVLARKAADEKIMIFFKVMQSKDN